MEPRSVLFLPPKPLASCIAAAIFRDTRGTCLADADRFNYFPASPLVSVTVVLSGELRLVPAIGDLSMAQNAKALPPLSVTPPQDHPTISWSPDAVAAVTVGFYPDAWTKLTSGIPNDSVATLLNTFDKGADPDASWHVFCKTLLPVWEHRRFAGGIPDWPGSDRLSDWSLFLFSRLAQTAPGRSMRTLERRLKQWTGRTRQDLDRYAAIEDLHRRTIKTPDASLAGLATDAGFSDQSHMGRAVRRTTGFSPRKLNHMIANEESFWCYRLLGERF